MKNSQISKRIKIIDITRGMCLILMILYHVMYDLTHIFNVPIAVMSSPWMRATQMTVAGLFIVISGISSNFSKNNIKRGIIVFIFGMILTLATFIMGNNMQIYFGVLHLLGASMIIYGLSEKLLRRIPKAAGVIIFTAIFIIWYVICDRLNPVEAPNLYIIGLYDFEFISSDYFPLLPWIFMFLAGSYIGMFIKEKYFPKWFYRVHFAPLEFIGRHTFIVYILHQPVIYVVLYVIFKIIK